MTEHRHGPPDWLPDLVIYHDKCADGIVAAWACWKRWANKPEYRAANYGYEPPADVDGKNVLIVDFSYPQAQLDAMIEAGVRSIVILDHHKTAQAALQAFQVYSTKPERFSPTTAALMLDDLRRGGHRPILAMFDMERSGARLAWGFAHGGGDVPRLVELAERYDLWKFEPGTMDRAEVLHLTIQAGDLTIARMDGLANDLTEGDGPLIEGAAIYDWRTQLIGEIASRAHLRTVADVEGVVSVECPYSLVSAVGHYLLDKYPAAPFAAMSVTGEKAVTWSLRSRDDRADVSAVAAGQGGGGHRNAAGFRIDLPIPVTSERLVEGWRTIDTFDGPSGPGNTVLVAVTGGGRPAVVGEAYFNPTAYDGTWWWAGTDFADYHSSPIDEIMHGVVTHWMPLPAAPLKEGEGE